LTYSFNDVLVSEVWPPTIYTTVSILHIAMVIICPITFYNLLHRQVSHLLSTLYPLAFYVLNGAK